MKFLKQLFLLCLVAWGSACAQSNLPACKGNFIQSDWSNCHGKSDWGSYVYSGEFSKNLPHGRGVKRNPDGTLIVSGIWEEGKLKHSDYLVDPKPCNLNSTDQNNCWTKVDLANGQRYVGFLASGKPHGEGTLYWPNGLVNQSGVWDTGNLAQQVSWNKSRFPFNNPLSAEATRALEAELERKKEEIERNRPPQQKIAFCVQTVQSSGTRYPSIDIPYCQDACNTTYADSMCQEIGGSKWRVQTSSPKTSPPNSQYFVGLGSRCACIGQEYVLNEIKETPQPSPVTTPTIQSESREAEFVKREKALAEREKALLEAENKRLRDELEAERKKKK